MASLNNLLESWRKILELVRRPDNEEYKLFLKVILLGFFLVGAIAFTINSITILVLDIAGR